MIDWIKVQPEKTASASAIVGRAVLYVSDVAIIWVRTRAFEALLSVRPALKDRPVHISIEQIMNNCMLILFAQLPAMFAQSALYVSLPT